MRLGSGAQAKPSKPAAPTRCGFPHARVLATSGASRIVVRATDDDELYGPVRRVYVCVTGRRPTLLATYDNGSNPTFSLFRFTAGYVAFARSSVDTTCTKYLPAPGRRCRL